MKLVTVAEMRALEQAAVDAGVPEVQLMEEAGLAVAQEAWLMLGTLEGRRIVALAGAGNNGGDAIVAARHLAGWGAEVTVCLPDGHRVESRVDGLGEYGITVSGPSGAAALPGLLMNAELVIDGLLGIGNARAVEPESPTGQALTALADARQGYSPPKVIAVDVPTGVNADTGAVDPLTVKPDLTVTFGFPKVGMYQLPASGMLGNVQVIDIGIPRAALGIVQLELLTSRWVREAIPPRPEDANKGTFGRLLVVGGSRRYQGAPRLAATAAYRAGAGLVTVAAPGGIIAGLAAGIPEATWLPLPEAEGGEIEDSAVFTLRAEWPNYSAAVLGPGMGDTENTRALTWAALADAGIDLPNGIVIDADALNALASMADAAERIPANAILTPHPGEMGRLLGRTTAEVQADRLGAARDAARRLGCTVVLKGAHSVIAAADGRGALSPFANPLLATAGTGDVLAGMIGAYLAQRMEPFEAACLGVYLHGAAGEALRVELGEAGLLASELATRLPSLVRELIAP
ncbi:MAG TPA: NAD(P)H-hydrate dehydratase [Tepidiformaceae bacterium]|nr:NAD(P)H-hydrate dehydratase [Tepidiformaceae bacterium]